MTLALAPSTPSTPPAAPPGVTAPAPKFVHRCRIYRCETCRGNGVVIREWMGSGAMETCRTCGGEGKYQVCQTIEAGAGAVGVA